MADHQILNLLETINPRHARTVAGRFRAYRNRAIIWLLADISIRRGELADLCETKEAYVIFEEAIASYSPWGQLKA